MFAGREGDAGQSRPTAPNCAVAIATPMAALNQVSLGYSGKFMDEKLRVSAGVRAPFFERELNQYCYTAVAWRYAVLHDADVQVAPNAQRLCHFPGWRHWRCYLPPYEGTKKYDKILPNLGVSYAPWDGQHVLCRAMRRAFPRRAPTICTTCRSST